MKKVILCVRSVGRNPDNQSLRSTYENYIPVEQRLEINGVGTTANTISTVQKDNMIIVITKENNGRE